MNKAFIYARVSMDEQREGYSIPVQLAAGRKWAADNDYEVAGEFVEDYTGKEYARPELDRMREAIERGEANMVIVYNIGRWARKLLWALMLEDEMRSLGAEVAYVQSSYDDTPEGDLHKQIEGSIMEYERKLILRRTGEGKYGRLQSGNLLPGRYAPYGYRYVGGEHKGAYEIVPEEAEVVRLIYQWYVEERIGTVMIARRLTEMGIPTRTDKATSKTEKKKDFGVWYHATITKLLHSQLYIGKYGWGRDPERRVTVSVPAIIDQAVWEAAQRVARQNFTGSPRNTRHEYLMRGRLICAECKIVLYAHVTRGNGYYYCKNRLPYFSKDGATKRHTRELSQARVDLEVWEKIEGALRNPVEFARNRDAALAQHQDDRALAEAGMADLAEKMREIQDQESRLADLYVMGKLSQAVLDEKARELDARVTAMRRQEMSYRDILSKLEHNKARIESTQQFVEKIQHRLGTLDFSEKRHVIEMLDIWGIATTGKTQEEDEIRVVFGSIATL